MTRVESAGLQGFLDMVTQRRIDQLLRGEVDADRQVFVVRQTLLPLSYLAAGLFQDPSSNRDDQTGFLSNRNKFVRCDVTVDRMLPPDQCLELDRMFCLEIQNGLIENFE